MPLEAGDAAEELPLVKRRSASNRDCLQFGLYHDNWDTANIENDPVLLIDQFEKLHTVRLFEQLLAFVAWSCKQEERSVAKGWLKYHIVCFLID